MGHTPGPWIVRRPMDDSEHAEIYAGDGGELVAWPTDNNADLIAAAPELLAALKQCLPLVDAYRRASGGDGDVSAAFARSVIAKAEGTNEQTGRVD